MKLMGIYLLFFCKENCVYLFCKPILKKRMGIISKCVFCVYVNLVPHKAKLQRERKRGNCKTNRRLLLFTLTNEAQL